MNRKSTFHEFYFNTTEDQHKNNIDLDYTAAISVNDAGEDSELSGGPFGTESLIGGPSVGDGEAVKVQLF